MNDQRPLIVLICSHHWRWFRGVMLLVGAIVILVIPWSHDPLLCAAITPELEVIPAPDLETIPAYPHRQAVCRTGGNVVSTFQTDDSPALVHTFYRETLANSGWDVTEQDDNRSTFSRGHIPDDPYAFGYFTQATIVITTRPTWVLFGKTLVGVTYIFRSGGREFGIVPARVVDVATNT